MLAEIPKSPSLFFAGMEGSRIPVVTAHGEGRAYFTGDARIERAIVAMRFVDNRGEPTERYPANPNGSPAGIAGVTTADGRFTIVMPHPERVFRTRPDVLAPRFLGRGQPVDARFPQRTGLVGLILIVLRTHCEHK